MGVIKTNTNADYYDVDLSKLNQEPWVYDLEIQDKYGIGKCTYSQKQLVEVEQESPIDTFNRLSQSYISKNGYNDSSATDVGTIRRALTGLNIASFRAGGFTVYNENFKYQKGAVVKATINSDVFYVSLVEDNIGNPLSDTTKWACFIALYNGNKNIVGGTNNAIAISSVGGIALTQDYLYNGLTLKFKAINNNTSAVIITIDGVDYELVNENGTSLNANTILAGLYYDIYYNATLQKFCLKQKKFDGCNFAVSGTADNIILTSRGGISFNTNMLYNGFAITFNALYDNTEAVSINIDGTTFNVKTSENQDLNSGDIKGNELIILSYNTSYNCFILFSQKQEQTIPIGSIIMGGEYVAENNKYLKLNSNANYNWRDYPDFLKYSGGTYTYNKQAPVCYTGAGYVYIDTEENKKVGNNVYPRQTPLHSGEITALKTYQIIDNDNNIYNRTNFNQYVFTKNNVNYYTTGEPSVGDNIYDNPDATRAETMTLLLIESLLANDFEYYIDTAGGRSFNNGELWTLKNDPVISDFILEAQTDPLNDVVGEIGNNITYNTNTDTITYNSAIYERSSSQPNQNVKFTWDGNGTEPDVRDIYFLSNNFEDGILGFNKSFARYVISSINYNGFAVGNTVSTDYYFKVENTTQEYKNSQNTIRYCLNPQVGQYCYSTPEPISVGIIASIVDGYNSSFGWLIRGNESNKLYSFNDVSISYYYNINKTLQIGSYLYNSEFPDSLGTYTAYTSTTITFQRTTYNVSDASIGEYLGSGTRYYAINDYNISVFFSSSSFAGSTVYSVSAKINEKTYRLSNGTIVRRDKTNDLTTFRLINPTGYPFIAVNNNTYSTTNGSLPNIKFNWHNALAIKRSPSGHDALSVGKVSWGSEKSEKAMYDASSAGIKRNSFGWYSANFNANNSNDIYQDNINQVNPKGFYVSYFVRVKK